MDDWLENLLAILFFIALPIGIWIIPSMLSNDEKSQESSSSVSAQQKCQENLSSYSSTGSYYCDSTGKAIKYEISTIEPVDTVDCKIKGNISFSTSEKIYHMPGQEFYDETSIDTSYGEKWFCSESEAISAGWRKASSSYNSSSNDYEQYENYDPSYDDYDPADNYDLSDQYEPEVPDYDYCDVSYCR